MTNSIHPKWSVMVPVYQPDQTYLKLALAGPLNIGRVPEEFQIEVVDDCSPSVDVATMVREIAGDRVSVYRSPQNQGLAGCWNLCIERAKGQWVHILHQDDIVVTEFYSALEKVIAENPTAVAAHTRHAICDSDGHWISLSHLELREPGVIPNFVSKLAGGQRIQCPSVVVRRDIYDKVGGFDPQWKYALDWEMWTRIASSGPWAFVPDILALYRMHDTSESSRLADSGRMLPDLYRGGLKCLSYAAAEDQPKSRRELNHFYGSFVLKVASQQSDFGLMSAAANSLKNFVFARGSLSLIPQYTRIWLKILSMTLKGTGK